MACTYTFLCPFCEKITEAELPMSIDQKAQHPPCVYCGEMTNYHWIPSIPQIVFRDGSSGSWPSKGNRIKGQRLKASEAASRRQKDRYGDGKKVISNYKGIITENWREAQSEVLNDKDIDFNKRMETAATYIPKIEAEMAGKIKT